MSACETKVHLSSLTQVYRCESSVCGRVDNVASPVKCVRVSDVCVEPSDVQNGTKDVCEKVVKLHDRIDDLHVLGCTYTGIRTQTLPPIDLHIDEHAITHTRKYTHTVLNFNCALPGALKGLCSHVCVCMGQCFIVTEKTRLRLCGCVNWLHILLKTLFYFLIVCVCVCCVFSLRTPSISSLC